MKQHEFTLDGVRFTGSSLDPETSLDGMAILSGPLADMLSSINFAKLAAALKAPGKDAAERMGDAADMLEEPLGKALRSFKELKGLAPLLMPAYRVLVNGPPKMEGSLVDLKTEVFAGRPLLLLAWLVAAIRAEYSDFLPSSGSTIFADLGALFGFQLRRKDAGPSGA